MNVSGGYGMKRATSNLLNNLLKNTVEERRLAAVVRHGEIESLPVSRVDQRWALVGTDPALVIAASARTAARLPMVPQTRRRKCG